MLVEERNMSKSEQLSAEEEAFQLLLASISVDELMNSKVRERGSGKAIPGSGVRTKLDQEITGCAQLIRMSQSYALEIAIKALHKNLNPNLNPPATHDFVHLFASLSRKTKDKLRKSWMNFDDRGHRSLDSKGMSLDDFLEKHRSMFLDSRYLYEASLSYIHTKDVAAAIMVFLLELMPDNPTFGANFWLAMGRSDKQI